MMMQNHAASQRDDRERMTRFMDQFAGSQDRLAKYMELALFGRQASLVAWQEMSSYRRIAITLTTRCNLNCVWCHRHEEAVKDYLHRDMDPALVRAMLPDLKGAGMLHWAGLGEPLLYPSLFEVTAEARRFVPRVKITTNATRLNEDMGRKLEAAGVTLVEVSIDGFDATTNEKCRGVPLGTVLEGLRSLSRATDIPIQINSAMSEMNYDSLFEAVDVLRDVKNIVCLHTIPLFMTKHMTEQGTAPVDPQRHQELVRHWEARLEHHGLKWRLSPDAWNVVQDPVITLKRRRNICFSVYEDPFINVYGDLAPCGRLQHMSLDSPAQGGFLNAWNGPKMLAFRKAQLEGRYGADCARECLMVRNVEGGGA